MIGRRALLGGSAALVAGAAVGARPVAAAAPGASPPSPPADTLPFRGAHQAGVTAPPAPAGIVAGLDVRAEDRAELIEVLETVSTEIEHVMSGAAFERRAGGFPPLDTGVLGPTPGPTDTSVLLGVGAALFDDRYGLADARPDGPRRHAQVPQRPHGRARAQRRRPLAGGAGGHARRGDARACARCCGAPAATSPCAGCARATTWSTAPPGPVRRPAAT